MEINISILNKRIKILPNEMIPRLTLYWDMSIIMQNKNENFDIPNKILYTF